MYKLQVEQGRYFLHEHPLGAWSWKLPEVINLMQLPGIERVRGDMCQHGMTIEDKQGVAPACKPTGWLSNSNIILQELNKLCIGGHRHADLTNGRAAKAQVYPEKLCLAILKGLRKQLIKDRVMFEGEIGTVCEDPSEKAFSNKIERSACARHFIDSVSGRQLDSARVLSAREDERRGVLSHQVFTKVPIQ